MLLEQTMQLIIQNSEACCFQALLAVQARRNFPVPGQQNDCFCIQPAHKLSVNPVSSLKKFEINLINYFLGQLHLFWWISEINSIVNDGQNRDIFCFLHFPYYLMGKLFKFTLIGGRTYTTDLWDPAQYNSWSRADINPVFEDSHGASFIYSLKKVRKKKRP